MFEYCLPGRNAPAFLALDEFTRGYIEALFFTSEEQLITESEMLSEHAAGWGDIGFPDLDADALEFITRECAAFQNTEALTLAEAYGKTLHNGTSYDAAGAGRDFWYTRNGHGVGFWDRGLGEIGDALANAARKYRALDVYMGDNGKIYVH